MCIWCKCIFHTYIYIYIWTAIELIYVIQTIAIVYIKNIPPEYSVLTTWLSNLTVLSVPNDTRTCHSECTDMFIETDIDLRWTKDFEKDWLWLVIHGRLNSQPSWWKEIVLTTTLPCQSAMLYFLFCSKQVPPMLHQSKCYSDAYGTWVCTDTLWK